jgi:small-conductance mechanosensitive channel
VLRSVCYAIALILVFSLFGAPVLPLSLALGAAAAVFGAAMLPTFRDAAQGYSLLAEDALAIGDVVEIGGHHGRIEKFSLRGLWLRDAAGRAHYLSNSEIKNFIVHSRHEEKQRDDKTIATRKT